ncbi:flagellar biosynthesis regulator FlaF [Pseudogemmobacter sp. W21_MBD1_M6]|jgi:flagellar biosynthesis activator protein FlaF|uniref:flagellar biosynthesis regulator FlaF n=1 Tax=Pseudogemmobacter sp. W21_MBD1_M6 TaxID=3240271 RepID=UPI003F9AD737
MNAIDRARTAYSSSATPLRMPRTTEYDAFARITHRLKDAAENGEASFPNLVDALYANRQLWTLLAVDVANEENLLPQSLRAQIFYLAEFTALHSGKVMDRTAKADVLVEINMSMMRGLRDAEARK